MDFGLPKVLMIIVRLWSFGEEAKMVYDKEARRIIGQH
jgi:hypothetical protein